MEGAKWTAQEYLHEALQGGTDFLYDTVVQRVMVENGRASGVVGRGPEGEIKISAEGVILCAGGLGSPVILQHSGIEGAGENLFVDLLVNTYGVVEGLDQTHEPPMAIVNHQYHSEKGFILSPYINSSRLIRFFEVGARAMTRSPKGLLGIMTKTADDPAGNVFPDGTVSKPVTEEDRARLREGSELAKKILVKMGADSKSIVVSKPQGAHPGGTAAIGRVSTKILKQR